jgi:hypothetical protein
MADATETVLQVLNRNLKSAWSGDAETYRATTAPDVSFFEWYVTPQRIDGIEFHLRELEAAAHISRLAAERGEENTTRFDVEVLQPRVQLYGDTAIVSYTFMSRVVTADGVTRKSNNETRVFHNFGSAGAPDWRLVHCHKSPLLTPATLDVLHS